MHQLKAAPPNKTQAHCKAVVAITLLLALCAPSLPATAALSQHDLLGQAESSETGRLIKIEPQTRYVNVTGGETVRFEINGKYFSWNFSGPVTRFDLREIAPAGLLDHEVIAYVAPNPNYIGRD